MDSRRKPEVGGILRRGDPDTITPIPTDERPGSCLPRTCDGPPLPAFEVFMTPASDRFSTLLRRLARLTGLTALATKYGEPALAYAPRANHAPALRRRKRRGRRS